MRYRLACVGLVAALWLGGAVQPAFAQPSDLAAAPRAVSGSVQQIEARRQLLLKAMMADPADLDVAFEYAALSVEIGDLEGAVSTLERMLIFAPGLPRLQLELGVLYYRLGANEVAKSHFDAVLAQPGVPDDVRNKVAVYLTAIDKGSQTSGFHGAIITGARYQTNANSAPSSNIVNLNGVDFLLGAAGVSSPDANGFVAGTFRYLHDLGSQGDRLVATLQAYGALYATQQQLNTGVVEATLGPDFNLQHLGIDGASLGFYGIGTGVLLGGNPYMLGLGAGTNLKVQLAPQVRAGVTLEYRREVFHNSAARPTAALRSGNRVNARGTVEYALGEDVTLFGVLLGERRHAQAGFQSFWELGATAGVVFDFDSPFQQFDEDWSLIFSATYLHRQFDAPDTFINAAVAQVDDDLQLSAALSMPFGDGLSLQTALSYRHVESNYGLADTRNVSVTAGAMKEF